MKKIAELFKTLSDVNRLRLLMVLDRKELCVCQLMGIVGLSQPLVSRNLSILARMGFLEERKEGKLKFYRIKKNLTDEKNTIMELLRRSLSEDDIYLQDMEAVQDCTEFQKRTGRCDMDAYKKFMKWRMEKRSKRDTQKEVV
ncbi:MAG: winged helix-turn-helix transcriptional regulator [Nitrospirae bacterium]|nr:winged helix-turn-helix transcriptional regulator [Nitrospirota bacterium]